MEPLEECVSKYRTNLDEDLDCLRDDSNPNPNFYNKIFETQIKNPFEKVGSFRDVKLEKNMKNYLKKNFKFSTQRIQNQGHYRSQSMNVLY